MKNIFSLLFLCLFLHACTQTKTDTDSINVGRIDHIHSAILGEDRTIWVHVPHETKKPFPLGAQSYPVVFLLDGDSHFHSFTGVMAQLAASNLCPEMIVVGIVNTNRTRDLTPTAGEIEGGGGGEQFAAFLENELIPYVNAHYPTLPYRMIVGHSLGGLTVINEMLYHPQVFQSFIAIDPSLWWNNQACVKAATSIMIGKANLNKKSMFLAVANNISGDFTIDDVRSDTTGENNTINAILNFVDSLDKKDEKLNWNSKFYENEDHSSIPLVAEYDGLKFIFQDYNFRDAYLLFDAKVSADSAVRLIDAHYQSVSDSMGGNFIAPEEYINALGYELMGDGLMDKAKMILEYNAKNYPQSSNVYDSLGDYYAKAGDKISAKKYYNQALQLKDNEETRTKLHALGN